MASREPARSAQPKSSRRNEVETILERLTQHCTATCGGSFLSAAARSRLFASTITSFGHESLEPPPGPESEAELDKVLRVAAHRMVRRQSSLDGKWYEQTKTALAGALSESSDEEGLVVEAALSETFLIVSLAACVFTCYVALEGPVAAMARCKKITMEKAALAPKDPFVSSQHWERLRRLSPKDFGTPLLKPFGPGDNAAKAGNRMHALERGAKGDILPPSVQSFLEWAYSVMGVKCMPMRSCTLVPGDMEAFLQGMAQLYIPIETFLAFAKLPGRELSRAEMECVADGTSATLACSF
eukprot:TRINITY_DN20217_c0_g1_i1.p1 TRINITY_DN20217_c0_g1~~TRINITY_DN20217_c0_g1_i1.p1  ORF type:complete len:311 (-),score=38.74 TRINITY_DN20217_c0_g1_i1:480-1376(-)